MSENHTQFTLIKNRDWNMSFGKWITYLKYRFQTRQWNSSLDFDSYEVHFNYHGYKTGITVEFPFHLTEETFSRRIGTAMESIHLYWSSSPTKNIYCPDSDGFPRETYWIMIMDEDNKYCQYSGFDEWVSCLEEYFNDNRWQHNINIGGADEHDIIWDHSNDEPVGIYVTMPYPLTFHTFLDRMDGRMDIISYVTKTTRKMDDDELSLCFQYGFFDPLDDGYWAVTNVEYIHKRTRRLMTKMILIIWVISFLVSIAPALGMKDDGWLERVLKQKICIVSQDLRYQIFATGMAFYVPLTIVLFLYWKIFQAAKSRIRKHVGMPGMAAGVTGNTGPRGGVIAGLVAGCPGKSGVIATAIVGAIGAPLPTITEGTTTNVTTGTTGSGSSGKLTRTNANEYETDIGTEATSSTQAQILSLPKPLKKKKQKKGPLDSKRERKAAKTLAIITGVFVGCWMPFFVLALILPLCRKFQCIVPQYIVSFSLWLGYLNSTINPFIYTTFNPEFRNAFRRLFRGQRLPRRNGPSPRYV